MPVVFIVVGLVEVNAEVLFLRYTMVMHSWVMQFSSPFTAAQVGSGVRLAPEDYVEASSIIMIYRAGQKTETKSYVEGVDVQKYFGA